MHEKIESQNTVEDNGVNNTNPLEEMAGQFDPDKARKAREEVKETLNHPEGKVVIAGEVSRILKSKNGNIVLESEYPDVYENYKNSANYDKEDRVLEKAIWDVGRNAALLDVSRDVATSIQNNGSLRGALLDSDSTKKIHEVMKAIDKITASPNKAAANKALDEIYDTGEVGRYLVDMYEATKEARERIRAQKNTAELDRLEQEYSEVMSSNHGIDTDVIQRLYSEYADQARKTTDPKTLEMIKERQNNLASINDRLEEIMSSMDW